MDNKFSVPIIPLNLNKHETIIQIAEVLDHLSNLTTTVFDQLNRKVGDNQNKLSSISNRIDSVKTKIKHLDGIKKATQVFSSCRYPDCERKTDYVSVFNDINPVPMKTYKIRQKNVPSSYEPLDKLQFYHVNISIDTSNCEDVGVNIDNLEFVNDLYVTEKSVSSVTDSKCVLNNREDDNTLLEIGDAPPSMSDRSVLKLDKNYFYAPKIGDIPALDVPIDLPDLPGIADDLHYDREIGPVVTPSAVITPCLMEDVNAPQPSKASDNDVIETPEALEPQPTNTELPKLLQIVHNQPAPSETLNTLHEHGIETKGSEVDSPPKFIEPIVAKPKAELPPVDDARSSLMEAIRNAGGSLKAPLRTVKQSDEDKPVTKSGDFMADLHNKLFMRRKGISGSKKSTENGVDPETTLGRISAMIPPPEPKNDVESTSNDDEEWD